MKKLLMFLFLMTISLGQSQTFPLDFTGGTDVLSAFDGNVFSIVTDGGNEVGQLASANQLYDNYQLELTQNLNLADDANNTITFRIKPIGDAGLATRSHLLKFENGVGGAGQTQLGFTTIGNDWQDITLDFGAGLGNYGRLVLFTDFNNTETGTYLIDDMAGGTNVAPPVIVIPTVAAPTPTTPSADVVSIFSGPYTDVAGTNFNSFSNGTSYSQVNIVGDPTLRYSNFVYQGITFASLINSPSMETLHIDVWTPDCTSLDIYVLDDTAPEQKVTVTPTLSGWNSYDIPLSSYSSLSKTNLKEFKFVGNGTIYLDNIYFWQLPAGSASYYVDADNDGYGAGAATVSSTPIAGSVTNATDCNDTNSAIYPGATEVADTVDNDCDGLIDEGFPPTVAAPTPPARNAWDVVSIFSGAYANTTLDELPTGWSQLAIEPFSVESIGGNDTWKFGGEFLGMVTNYDNGININDMTMVHIDYWTPDPNLLILKIVNTVDGGDATTIIEDPTVSGSWRSRDIPMATFGGSINKTKITQLLIDPQSGGSTVYVDNFYFYRPATGAPSPSIGALTVPAKVIGDPNFDLAQPSSNSGGAFTYSSSNESVATISGSTVTIVGAGSSIITATQAAAGAYGTGSTSATLVVSLATAAPTPTIPADRVLSVFSGAPGYGTLAGTSFYPNWGQATQFALESIAGNSTIRYSNLNYQGIQLGSVLDLTSYDSVHVDIYGAGTTAVNFSVINQAGGAGSPDVERLATTAITLNPGWNSVVIPVSSLTTLNSAFELNRVGQLSFTGSGTIYVDNIFFSKAVPTPVAPTAADIAFCKGSVTALTAIPSGTNALRWYTVSTGGTALASAPIPTATKTYYVAQVMSNGTVSPRAALIATVNILPSTPASMATTDAVLCKHIGTTNEVTYTVPVVAGIEDYSWSLPSGVTAIGATDSNTITVNFAGSALNNTSVGGIGTISARAISALGCSSLPRSLVLTAKLPTSPTSLVMTSTDNTDHFNLPVVPATIPATFTFSSLADLTKITKVGPYMGTNTVFTLTAALATTAASYEWTLPGGVTQLSGGTSRTITVDFAGVASGIGTLPIVVKSEGGCGKSSARTLTLARALPTSPTALVLTESPSTVALTKVSPYTGKSTELTLTATPVRVQGATATSYAWLLPAGVNIISPAVTTDVTVYQLVNTGSVEVPNMVNTAFTAKSTGLTSTITIDFAGVAFGTSSFPLTVFAVNGAGNSKARTRTVTAAAPLAPSIVGSGGTGTATQFSSCATKTYTATSLSPGVTAYNWTVPAGATFTGGTGNVIVVDYSGVAAAVGVTVPVTCSASNGTATSTAKIANVKRIACPLRLANGSSANDFKVSAYPNPSSSEFTIESSAKGAMSVKVYDMQGRLVEKAETNRVGSRLAKGVYNVIVNQGANTKSVRVIKN